MLCSRCHEPVMPIVSLDIDGTMGDYHHHFVRFALLYMGMKPDMTDHYVDKYVGTVPMRMWFCATFGVSEDVWRDIKLAYRQGAQKRSMPVSPWASPITKRLKERHVEIWVTTTRPYLRLDGVDPDTRFWLKHNNILYDHLLYD